MQRWLAEQPQASRCPIVAPPLSAWHALVITDIVSLADKQALVANLCSMTYARRRTCGANSQKRTAKTNKIAELTTSVIGAPTRSASGPAQSAPSGMPPKKVSENMAMTRPRS